MKHKISPSKLTKLALAGIAAGALSLSACKKNSTSGDNEFDEAALAKFIADCEAAGHEVQQHDCQGMNSCKGESFQIGVGATRHECATHSSCKGASCVEGM